MCLHRQEHGFELLFPFYTYVLQSSHLCALLSDFPENFPHKRTLIPLVYTQVSLRTRTVSNFQFHAWCGSFFFLLIHLTSLLFGLFIFFIFNIIFEFGHFISRIRLNAWTSVECTENQIDHAQIWNWMTEPVVSKWDQSVQKCVWVCTCIATLCYL